MNELQLNRRLLSAYFISILFSTLLFRLSFFRGLIRKGRDVMESFITNLTNQNVSELISWISLISVCFLIVFTIKRFIVEPMGLYMDADEDLTRLESGILLILIAGSLIYYVNIYFGQSMPSNSPEIIQSLLVGEGGKYESLIPVLWNIGPLVYLYATYKDK